MVLTISELEWVGMIAGKSIDEASQTAAIAHQGARDAFLTEELAQNVDAVSSEIDAAMGLRIKEKNDPSAMRQVWETLSRQKSEGTEIPWRSTDGDLKKAKLAKWAPAADLELDIREVDREMEKIPSEDIANLRKAHERILKMQEAMLAQLDENGERLFSDEDVRREVWTPFVRAGLIPENMVPDKFSEQAIAFNGAAEFYQEKIEAFSQTHTEGVESLKGKLSFAKDVVVLAGALTAGAVTISNATDIAGKEGEVNGHKEKRGEIDDKLEAKDPPPTAQEKIVLEKQKEAINKDITAANADIKMMKNETLCAEAATAILTGGLDLTEIIVDHRTSEEDNTLKWSKTLEKGLALAQGVSTKSVTASMNQAKADGALVTCVTMSITAAFTGAKMLPAGVIALRESDPDKQSIHFKNIMIGFADAVASSVNAVGASLNDGSDGGKDAQAEFKNIAEIVKTGVVQLGNIPAIKRAIKNGNSAELALLLGGGAIAAAFGATSKDIYDGVRKDEKDGDLAAMSLADGTFRESTTDQDRSQDAGAAASLDAVNKALDGTSKVALDGLKNITVSALEATAAAELQEQIIADVDKAQKEVAKAELDAAFTKEAVAEMMNNVDQELIGFTELYSDAYPDPKATQRTAEEILQAQNAITKAMANTAALRQKVAIINGFSSTAANILKALVPGTGAVAAAVTLAQDVYKMFKCIEVHNAWCDSMALAFDAQSGAAAAIQNTMHNAKIHLDHSKVKALLSAAKVGTEVARVCDPTGGATIASAAVSMSSAVVEFGYKRHGEAAVKNGWNAYKAAQADPGNRKLARSALRMNSTLAKCCIAYGASIMGDTAAKQAMRASGLSIAAMQNDKDICKRLIEYLEAELKEDPVVLKVEKTNGRKWHPGRPALGLASWTAFKAAAVKSAEPKMAKDSLKTPGVDRLFAALLPLKGWQDNAAVDAAIADGGGKLAKDENAAKPAQITELLTANEAAVKQLARLESALNAYAPKTEGITTEAHAEMSKVAASFATLAKLAGVTAGVNADKLNAFNKDKYPPETAELV